MGSASVGDHIIAQADEKAVNDIITVAEADITIIAADLVGAIYQITSILHARPIDVIILAL